MVSTLLITTLYLEREAIHNYHDQICRQEILILKSEMSYIYTYIDTMHMCVYIHTHIYIHGILPPYPHKLGEESQY